MDWHGYRVDLYCSGGCDARVIVDMHCFETKPQLEILSTFDFRLSIHIPFLPPRPTSFSLRHVKRRASLELCLSFTPLDILLRPFIFFIFLRSFAADFYPFCLFCIHGLVFWRGIGYLSSAFFLLHSPTCRCTICTGYCWEYRVACCMHVVHDTFLFLQILLCTEYMGFT